MTKEIAMVSESPRVKDFTDRLTGTKSIRVQMDSS